MGQVNRLQSEPLFVKGQVKRLQILVQIGGAGETSVKSGEAAANPHASAHQPRRHLFGRAHQRAGHRNGTQGSRLCTLQLLLVALSRETVAACID